MCVLYEGLPVCNGRMLTKRLSINKACDNLKGWSSSVQRCNLKPNAGRGRLRKEFPACSTVKKLREIIIWGIALF